MEPLSPALIKSDANRRYRRSKLGVITNSYHQHIARSARRGYPPPDYTLAEMQAVFLNAVDFEAVFNAWVNNGYTSYDRPSFDRIDPMLPYRLDNLQILTWGENRRKGDLEKIRTCRTQVVMCDMDGTVIKEFDSTKEASRVSGCNQCLITMCCQGKRNHTGGYKWRYGKEHRRKTLAIYDRPQPS